jgi:hypothetical protein
LNQAISSLQFKLKFGTIEDLEKEEKNSLLSEHLFSTSHKKKFKTLFDELQKFREYKSFYNIRAKKLSSHKQKKKKWTILVYIAGDNDLYKYAIRNLEQLQHIGSNDNLNILVHFDFKQKGKKKESKRFFLEKNSLLQIGDIPAGDSGDADNLISAGEWAIKNYPSHYFGLVLWNHGTGPYDPELFHYTNKQLKPNDFFFFDKKNKKISINRNIEFFDILHNPQERGICFDDTTRNYLNHKRLSIALHEIYKMRNNEKIDIIMMDACLMAGIEIAEACSKYAKILAASEEVVLGPGYNYSTMLKILAKENITPYDFAIHIIRTYQQTYGPISNDFTQSAINLSALDEATELYGKIVSAMIELHKNDKKENFKKLLKISGSKEMVTHFAEPSYIDLKHFLEIILHNINQYVKNKFFDQKDIILIKELKNAIQQFLQFYPKLIIANCYGQYIPKASGLFVYFPNKRLEGGYKNDFATKTKWIQFLQELFS